MHAPGSIFGYKKIVVMYSFMVVAKATCPLYTQSATAVLSKNMAQSSGSASGCAYRNFSGGRAKKFHQMTDARMRSHYEEKFSCHLLFPMIHRA